MLEIAEITEEFQLFDDWEDKYAYLIELGKKLPPLPEPLKTEESKVHGCTSQVWLVKYQEEGDADRVYFKADSDAFIVKGLIALLLRIYSGKTKQQILQVDIEQCFKALEFGQYLSPSRSNGFFAMVERIRTLAQ